MTRIIKVLALASMSSVYLMQVPCTSNGNGLNILPFTFPNIFAGLYQGLLGGFTT